MLTMFTKQEASRLEPETATAITTTATAPAPLLDTKEIGRKTKPIKAKYEIRLVQTLSFGVGGIFCVLVACNATNGKADGNSLLYLLGLLLICVAGFVLQAKSSGK